MAAPNGEQTFMHMLQAFLINTTQQIRTKLPDDTVFTAQGRTIVRGLLTGQPFGVRIFIDQAEDDMWPRIQAVIETGNGAEESFDVFPDNTATEHADIIVERLHAAMGRSLTNEAR